MNASTAPKPGIAWLRHIPTLLVLAGLGAAAWWGHTHGWSLPKPSSEGTTEAWCDEHSVPEAICVECNAALLPRLPSFGWCNLHAVPECPMCHPELAQTEQPGKPKYDVIAAMKLLPRQMNDKACKLHERRIQFASNDAVKKTGLDIAVVSEGPMGEYVSAPADAIFDPAYVTRLSSPVTGRIVWIAKSVGDTVQKGELIALIDATDVGKGKNELLQAVAVRSFRARAFETAKAASVSTSDARIREAEAALREADVRVLAAEQSLANLGFSISASALESLSAADAATKLKLLGIPETVPANITSANLFPLRAPAGGTVVTRDASAGEMIDLTKPLFLIADPVKMLLTLHVRDEDSRDLKIGQAVRFDNSQNRKLAEGTIARISPALDEKTRTLPVTVLVSNPDRTLKDHTFGIGRVILREEPNAIIVPNAAVHWDGTCNIVFIRDKNYLKPGSYKIFHVRKVVLGARNETHTEILAGVLPGEVVASRGSAALRGELLKAGLGEGCACHH